MMTMATAGYRLLTTGYWRLTASYRQPFKGEMPVRENVASV